MPSAALTCTPEWNGSSRKRREVSGFPPAAWVSTTATCTGTSLDSLRRSTGSWSAKGTLGWITTQASRSTAGHLSSTIEPRAPTPFRGYPPAAGCSSSSSSPDRDSTSTVCCGKQGVLFRSLGRAKVFGTTEQAARAGGSSGGAVAILHHAQGIKIDGRRCRMHGRRESSRNALEVKDLTGEGRWFYRDNARLNRLVLHRPSLVGPGCQVADQPGRGWIGVTGEVGQGFPSPSPVIGLSSG